MMWMCCASNLDILQLTRTVSTEQNSKQLTFSYPQQPLGITPPRLHSPHTPPRFSIPIRTWPRHTVEKFCRSESSLTSPRYLSKTWPFPTDATSPTPALLRAVSGWWGSWTEILHDPSPVFGGLLVKSLSFPFHSILIKITWKQWSLVIQSFSLDFAIQSLAYFQIIFTDISTPGLDSAVK